MERDRLTANVDIPEEAFAKPRGLNPPATNWQFVRDLIAYAYEHGYHEHGYDVLAELLGQVRAGASREPGESRLPRETTVENEPDEPAYPWGAHGGLTKRELFAAMALQGMVGDPSRGGHLADYVRDAVKAADFLIEELTKKARKSRK